MACFALPLYKRYKIESIVLSVSCLLISYECFPGWKKCRKKDCLRKTTIVMTVDSVDFAIFVPSWYFVIITVNLILVQRYIPFASFSF